MFSSLLQRPAASGTMDSNVAFGGRTWHLEETLRQTDQFLRVQDRDTQPRKLQGRLAAGAERRRPESPGLSKMQIEPRTCVRMEAGANVADPKAAPQAA